MINYYSCWHLHNIYLESLEFSSLTACSRLCSRFVGCTRNFTVYRFGFARIFVVDCVEGSSVDCFFHSVLVNSMSIMIFVLCGEFVV